MYRISFSPDTPAFPIGGPNSIATYIVIQMHYDNPNEVPGTWIFTILCKSRCFLAKKVLLTTLAYASTTQELQGSMMLASSKLGTL